MHDEGFKTTKKRKKKKKETQYNTKNKMILYQEYMMMTHLVALRLSPSPPDGTDTA